MFNSQIPALNITWYVTVGYPKFLEGLGGVACCTKGISICCIEFQWPVFPEINTSTCPGVH